MVGQRQSPTSEASYLRKVRKPLIERKRRERMNNSLLQLKSLLAATISDHTSPNAKLDKADILELTVRHLILLQQQQRSVTMAMEVGSYSSGFKECAKETIGYLASTKQMNDTSICNLSNHLHNSYLVRTGSVSSDQVHQVFDHHSTNMDNLNTTADHSNMASYRYTHSPYVSYEHHGNSYKDTTSASDDTDSVVSADLCEQKVQYKDDVCSLQVAPLIHDDEKVWRPW